MTDAADETPARGAGSRPGDGRRRRFLSPDAAFGWMSRLSACVVLLMLAALLFVLGEAAIPAIRDYGARFLVSSDWRPNELEIPKRDARGKLVFDGGEVVTEKIPPSFGALPVVYGTLISSALALLFAVPLSLGAAIFLVRIAPPRVRGLVSFLVEFLATIPSIAYGVWGLFVLAPLLQDHVEPALQSLLQHLPGFGWLFMDTHGRPLALTGREDRKSTRL